MKFKDLDGNPVSKDITGYKRPKGGRANSSKGQKSLGDMLETLFPQLTIYEEMPCAGTGHPPLRLDFFLSELKIAFEFDGGQHEAYSPFLHGSRAGYIASQNRDSRKADWCHVNGFRLIRVTDATLDLTKLEDLIRGST